MRWLKILSVQSAIALLLLEGLLRVHNPFPFRLRGDDIVLPAGLHYRLANQNPGTKLDPITVHTRNRLGFRGPEVPADFASRLSIVAVGGSTTECFLLSDGKAWPAVMAGVLAGSQPNVWVNNAGFDGHSTYGHLVLLRSVLVKLKPSIMLVLAGVNDVGMEPAGPGDEFDIPDPDTWRLWPRLSRHSELANTALNIVRARRAARLSVAIDQPVDFASLPKRAMTEEEITVDLASYLKYLEGYSARLSALVLESRAAAIEPVLLTQPALAGDAVDPATGADLSTIDVGTRNGRAEWRLLELHNDIMRQTAARHGVFLIDLARQLPKDSRYYYDFYHFSNEGAVAVGEIVAAELGRHLVR